MEQVVRFDHSDYGEMTTTVKNWVECWLFDASIENGDAFPVNKEDCSNPRVESI